MGPIALTFIFVIVAAVSALPQQPSANETPYKSPDGLLVAVVSSFTQPEGTLESKVTVKTASGRIVARQNYRSKDGEHGYSVTKAQWTPDSQFFVYSIESSGGHAAWHSPVLYLSCKTQKLSSLDAALGDAVMNPQFSVHAPDKVTVELYFAKKTVTVSLSSLSAKPRPAR